MTTTKRYERRITAFMEDPDNMNIGNIIHANAGAQQFGYRAALVGGATVYGWAIPAVIQPLGTGWLENGWAEVSFRKPTYPGDEMAAIVSERGDGVYNLVVVNQDGEVCVSGQFGLGRAAWLGDLQSPQALCRSSRAFQDAPRRLPLRDHFRAAVGPGDQSQSGLPLVPPLRLRCADARPQRAVQGARPRETQRAGLKLAPSALAHSKARLTPVAAGRTM